MSLLTVRGEPRIVSIQLVSSASEEINLSNLGTAHQRKFPFN